MDEALAELARYFRRQAAVSAGELVQLAAAARARGSRWEGIAAACGIRDYRDIVGIAALPCWTGSDTGADLLFSAAQHAVHQLTGSRGLFAPLSWPCPDCRQQVTDRAVPSPGARFMSSTAMRPAAPAWSATRPRTTTSAEAGCPG